jgi:cysteine sulfinate desulfinase/cysteine desulfurase-like protein
VNSTMQPWLEVEFGNPSSAHGFAPACPLGKL